MNIVKILGVIMLLLVIIIPVGYLWINEPLPEPKEGISGDELAHKMLDALNKDAYDAITYLEWVFSGKHSYKWEKEINRVEVTWDDMKVLLYPDNLTGSAEKSGESLSGEELTNALQTAWKHFANDSFWLVAPYKVFDPGTTRFVVDTDRGEALLVTYHSGGVTPGDSYLWILDNQFRPVAWKMWTQKIPIGGLELSWENWGDYNGAWLATDHVGPKNIPITNLKVR